MAHGAVGAWLSTSCSPYVAMGTADAEIDALSVENSELSKALTVKPGVG